MEENSATNGIQNEKILIVEDDVIIGELYVNSLSELGYQVTWARDGKSGLAAALQETYDIILLDIMMPGKNGATVLKELRGNGDKVPNSKVIVFTNLAQDDETRDAMSEYADDYLIKADITPRQLIAKINQLLSKNE
ncbi:MAG: response regulator [Candidatus Nomurabacteria bacterium]|jgi:DNA-binding response OmpR family regulator|nr:response regulator [Candidatus Nomurabacteria bacterium]